MEAATPSWYNFVSTAEAVVTFDQLSFLAVGLQRTLYVGTSTKVSHVGHFVTIRALWEHREIAVQR